MYEVLTATSYSSAMPYGMPEEGEDDVKSAFGKICLIQLFFVLTVGGRS